MINRYIFYQIFLCYIFYFAISVQTISRTYLDLTGGGWKLSNHKNKGYNFDCHVPSSVQVILQSEGIIDDPNYRFNDLSTRWIAEEDWEYSKYFSIPELKDDVEFVYLQIDGIDTVADIFINNVKIASVKNMFRQYILSIPVNILLKENNIINIIIKSSIKAANKCADEYPYELPMSPAGPEPLFNRQYLRKAGCHFGWDWGPALMSLGIYRNIGILIVPKKTVLITKYSINTENLIPNENCFNITVSTTLLSSYTGSSKLIFFIYSLNIYHIDNIFLIPGFNEYNFTIYNICNIKKWWPNTLNEYGTPFLYNAQLSITGESNWVDKKDINIGFRTIILHEPKGKLSGNEFYFSINNVPMYSKGSNLIPLNSFETSVTKDDLYQLLSSAVLSSSNTIRVWGGGVYQPDFFYELADELGLLIWTEFMFACALYPRNDEFLYEVDQEMYRMMSHPSILLWSANNENLGAINWYDVSRKHIQLYSVDYSILYLDIIRNRVKNIDNVRPFVHSSPSNGIISEDPYVVEWNDVQNPTKGDVHFYNYNDNCMNDSIYPSPRYSSEFGFQSYPSIYTLSKIALTSDFNFSSPLMDHRQHHPDGNKQIMNQISLHFRPPSNPNKKDGFIDFVFLSQACQAICMQTEFAKYRRLLGDSYIHTMGTLYWQLNDIWQAPSWSSIESNGKYKMLQYIVKRAYQPLSLSIYETNRFPNNNKNNQVLIHIINDKNIEQITNDVTITIFSWKNGYLKSIKPKFERKISPFSTILLLNSSITTLFSSFPNCKYNSNVAGKCGISVILNDNIFFDYFFGSLEHSDISPSKKIVTNNWKQVDETSVSFTIYSHNPVAFLWMTLSDKLESFYLSNNCNIIFSDNAFIAFYHNETNPWPVVLSIHCPPFYPHSGITLDLNQVKENLIFDSYNDHIKN